MVRILLVDDHAIFRDGLKALISAIDGFQVVAEANDGEEALEIINTLKIDLVLTDIHMTGMDGIKLTRLLRKNYSDLRIIVLTMDSEKSYIQAIQEMGANGYVTKATNVDRLKEVLQAVLHNSTVFHLAISNRQVAVSADQITTPFSNLTNRELEILDSISQGFTDKEIAAQKCLSPYTVITHRRNLLTKLGLSNKVELTRIAIENGLGQGNLLH